MKEMLGRRFRRLLGFQPQWQPTQLLDRTVMAQPGIVRDTADYDDSWLVACASHARVAFDVGANQGQAALMMLVANPRLRIVSIDANATALVIAAEHLIRNQLSMSAVFVEAFVGASDGEEVMFYTVSAGAAGSMYATHAKSAAKSNHTKTVRTATIDTLVRQTAATPDFIKIDIEGAEALALDGMRETARNASPRIMVEMHSNTDLPMSENSQRVLD